MPKTVASNCISGTKEIIASKDRRRTAYALAPSVHPTITSDVPKCQIFRLAIACSSFALRGTLSDRFITSGMLPRPLYSPEKWMTMGTQTSLLVKGEMTCLTSPASSALPRPVQRQSCSLTGGGRFTPQKSIGFRSMVAVGSGAEDGCHAKPSQYVFYRFLALCDSLACLYPFDPCFPTAIMFALHFFTLQMRRDNLFSSMCSNPVSASHTPAVWSISGA